MVPMTVVSKRSELQTLLGQQVTIVRPAVEGDEGFVADGEMSIVRDRGGREWAVRKDELSDRPISANQGPQGGPNAYHPSQVTSGGPLSGPEAIPEDVKPRTPAGAQEASGQRPLKPASEARSPASRDRDQT